MQGLVGADTAAAVEEHAVRSPAAAVIFRSHGSAVLVVAGSLGSAVLDVAGSLGSAAVVDTRSLGSVAVVDARSRRRIAGHRVVGDPRRVRSLGLGIRTT
jgi:hypothetical protein